MQRFSRHLTARARVRVRPYLLVFVRGDASEKLFSDSLASYTYMFNLFRICIFLAFLSPGKILISEYSVTLLAA